MLLRKTLRSSTFRLALLYVMLFGAAIFTIFGYVYWSTAEYFMGQSDAAIRGEIDRLLHAYEESGLTGLAQLINERREMGSLDQGVYLLVTSSRSYLAGNLEVWPAAMSDASGWANFRAEEWKPEADERPLLRATYRALPGGYRLLVGKDIEGYDDFVESIGIALTCGVGLIITFTVIAGVSVSRRTVSRIEAINAMTREIMDANLARRIPLRGTNDEWDQLAVNLNSMLNRIRELVHAIKQVSDGIAHDLRTPLTRIHGRLQSALNRGRSSDRHQELIRSTIAEIDAVLRMFSALLRISMIEAEHRTQGFQPVDVSEIASGVVELFDAAAEGRGGRINFVGQDGVLVMGDRDLLFDALSNLVDNAIKYGAGAGDVTVEVADHGQAPNVSISDRGAGIPLEERERVFAKFYRLERGRSAAGSGLGLSLVAAVVQLHGAEIILSDNHPGLRVEVRFRCFRGTPKNADPLPRLRA